MADAQRWTIITGASSGIGTELAWAFAARGASLVLTARREDRLAALKAGIEAAHAVSVEVIALDLEQPDAPDRLVAALEARAITIHTLVNSAGFGLRGNFATLPYEEQIAMLQLNIVALTKLCRLVLPGLLARRAGGILNVASTAAFQAVPYLGAYAATKAYVLSLSEALHEECRGRGVTITALCPGPTATEFAARADLEKSKLMKGAMSAADVAAQAVAGYEAGRAIVVTGAANKLGTLMVKFVPRALVRWGAGKLQG
jgi:short-subunit dehydrogenase